MPGILGLNDRDLLNYLTLQQQIAASPLAQRQSNQGLPYTSPYYGFPGAPPYSPPVNDTGNSWATGAQGLAYTYPYVLDENGNWKLDERTFKGQPGDMPTSTKEKPKPPTQQEVERSQRDAQIIEDAIRQGRTSPTYTDEEIAAKRRPKGT